jgi:phosphatidate cytidylyltransferase
MLLKRVITAAILIPVVVLAISLLPKNWFFGISGLVFLLVAWEWARLIGFMTKKAICGFLLIVFFSFWLIAQISAPVILLIGVLLWLGLIYFIFNLQIFAEIWSENRPLRSILGIVLIAICWFAINFIRNQDPFWGPFYLINLLIWIWSADSGAYFIGRHFGKQKLAPAISPGKTIEGAIGGIGLTLIVAAVLGLFFPFGLRQYIGFMLLAVLISMVTVVGDLFESMVKRQAGVKDSGRILPGHGGILDRLDSLISAAPFFAAGLWLLEYTLK